MPNLIKKYVRIVDRMNYLVGRGAMYMIFVMIAVLFYSSVTKVNPYTTPSLWTLDVSQFLMMAYFILGGPYSMQIDGHVRMDLFYGEWSDRTKALVDAITIIFLIGYLAILLYGAVSSTTYAINVNERGFSMWRPYMWPIKLVMTIGIFFMLLQATSQFIKDVAAYMGKPLR